MLYEAKRGAVACISPLSESSRSIPLPLISSGKHMQKRQKMRVYMFTSKNEAIFVLFVNARQLNTYIWSLQESRMCILVNM